MIKHGGDLHNDQTYIDTKIYRWEHLELKLMSELNLSNMYTCYITQTYLNVVLNVLFGNRPNN